ncbi:hypothetical protein B0H11DRAFT_1920896 [Mycena galericulata]|nr:hypothetical protein B0H11DRAFT_1920896 [Mycena galericulata]
MPAAEPDLSDTSDEELSKAEKSRRTRALNRAKDEAEAERLAAEVEEAGPRLSKKIALVNKVEAGDAMDVDEDAPVPTRKKPTKKPKAKAAPTTEKAKAKTANSKSNPKAEVAPSATASKTRKYLPTFTGEEEESETSGGPVGVATTKQKPLPRKVVTSSAEEDVQVVTAPKTRLPAPKKIIQDLINEEREASRIVRNAVAKQKRLEKRKAAELEDSSDDEGDSNDSVSRPRLWQTAARVGWRKIGHSQGLQMPGNGLCEPRVCRPAPSVLTGRRGQPWEWRGSHGSGQEVADSLAEHTINSTCSKSTFHIGLRLRLDVSPVLDSIRIKNVEIFIYIV